MILDRISVEAAAKINFGLNILEKREDGFHNIETIYIPLQLKDKITLEKRRKGIVINCDHPDVPLNDQNLAFQAAKLLRTKGRFSGGVTITIDKKIPVAAGLGGGSSDAAAILKGLNILWNTNFSVKTLKKLGLEIGADVPFFIINTPCIGKGKGEILQPIPFKYSNSWIAVIYPNIKIDSKWAYDNFALTKDKKILNFYSFLKKSKDPKELRKTIINDFESVVFSKYPEIENIKKSLYDLGADFSLLTGSGSTIYGIFKRRETAQKACEKFRSKHLVFVTQPRIE